MTKNAIENSIPADMIAAADHLCREGLEPYGYAINPGPVPTKTKHWGIFTDMVNPDCLFILTRWFDGTGIFLRYPKRLVVVHPWDYHLTKA